MNFATLLAFAALFHLSCSHSIMSYPEPMTGTSCRMGGDPKFGVQNCPGPCRIDRYINDDGKPKKYPYTAVYPPNNPVKEVFKRGQKFTVKYTRNNHGPGGFNRFTLVRYKEESGPETAKDYMDKAIHARNAFHYSCWGARPVVAQGKEATEKGEFGLSMIGSDAEQHDQAAGYYVTDITIPPVVPDGLYILGWVWFGGVSGKITTNDPQVPDNRSYFSDYWGCSFIKIEGGVPLEQSYMPVFNNDYAFNKNSEGAEGSEEGCMAQNDKPGVCVSEPCKGIEGFYRKPAAFKDGPPRALTPADFGGENVANNEAPLPPSHAASVKEEEEEIVVPPTPLAPQAEEEEVTKPSASASPEQEEEMTIKEEGEVVKPSVSALPKKEEDQQYTEKTSSPSDEVEGEKIAKPSAYMPEATMKEEGKGEDTMVSSTDKEKALRTCKCMYYGSRCSSSYAEKTYGCIGKTLRSKQPAECKKVCCDICTSSHSFCEYMKKTHCSGR